MVKRRVIVKRLDAIEDIGAIDVLCTDKTGTLTAGTIVLDAALDLDARPSELVRRLGWLNATGQNGLLNPVDQAIAATPEPDRASEVSVLGEVPYDFMRRVLSVLVDDDGVTVLITKGAVESVLTRCAIDRRRPAAAPEAGGR